MLNTQPRKLNVVTITTKEDVEIEIPLLDFLRVEIEEGRWIFVGQAYDIFA
jgi:hypothetical protein